MPTTEKPQLSKKQQAKREKRRKRKAFRRRTFLVLTLFSILFLAGFTAFKILVKPPDIAPSTVSGNSSNTKVDPDAVPNFVSLQDLGERKEEFFTFLVAGVDYSDYSYRTDVMMVVAYDVKAATVNVLNVPRDTISECDRAVKKINSAYQKDTKVKRLKDELSQLIGIPIDRYAVIDFDGFEKVIDAIGGVQYNVPFHMEYNDYVGLHINIEPGEQLLDGKQALHFIRYRQGTPGTGKGYADGDIGRINARVDFLKAAMKQIASPKNILKFNDLAQTVFENTETDMTLSEMIWLGMRGIKINSESISMVMLPGADQMLYEADFGYMQSYFIPNEQKILELINASFNPYKTPITQLKLKDISGYPTSKP